MFTFSLIHFQLNELTVSLQSDFATTYVRESSPCSQISTYGPSFLPARSSAMLCRHSLTPYLNPSWGYSCSTAYVVTVTVKKKKMSECSLKLFYCAHYIKCLFLDNCFFEFVLLLLVLEIWYLSHAAWLVVNAEVKWSFYNLFFKIFLFCFIMFYNVSSL